MRKWLIKVQEIKEVLKGVLTYTRGGKEEGKEEGWTDRWMK